MVFLNFLFLLIINLEIIYGLNGFIFDGSLKLAPTIISYNIDMNKDLQTIKHEIIDVLKRHNINGDDVWFYYLDYNNPETQFIPNDDLKKNDPNKKDGEIIFIVYQKENDKIQVCRHALLLLKTVKSIAFKNKNYYFGEYSKNDSNKIKPNGKGMMRYNSGDMYSGDWIDGKRSGKGISVTSEYMYDGEWKNDQANGKGKLVTSNEDEYNGDFVNDVKEGQGIMKFADGNTYNGEWKNGKIDGDGKFTWPDGAVYIGEFKDNQREGVGALTTNEWEYTGDFIHNAMEGHGILQYKNGKIYIGQMVNNNPNGEGMSVWDGIQYIGGFKDFQFHGEGRMVHKDGKITDGTWKDDRYISRN